MASIHKDVLKSGKPSYCVRWRDPVTHKPKNQRFRRMDDAKAWKAKVENGIAEGTYVDRSGKTDLVRDVVSSYIDEHPTARAGTKDVWQNYARHITSHVGDIQAGRLQSEHVDTMGEAMLSKGVGAPTVNKTIGFLSQVLRKQVKKKRLPGNVAADVDRPTIKKRTGRALKWTEVERLAACCGEIGGYESDLLVRFLGLTGLRIGEACALRVDRLRLDDEYPYVDVYETCSEVRGEMILGPTKTGEPRTVPLQDDLATQLRAYVAGKASTDILFPETRSDDGGGEYLRRKAWDRQVFAKATIMAGIPPIGGRRFRIHDLRHTAKSLWQSIGVTRVDAQEWLGHSDETMTSKYSHGYGLTPETRGKLNLISQTRHLEAVESSS